MCGTRTGKVFTICKSLTNTRSWPAEGDFTRTQTGVFICGAFDHPPTRFHMMAQWARCSRPKVVTPFDPSIFIFSSRRRDTAGSSRTCLRLVTSIWTPMWFSASRILSCANMCGTRAAPRPTVRLCRENGTACIMTSTLPPICPRVTEMLSDTQVIIVGAGPVGLTLALDLGYRGIRCVLIEQKQEPQFLPKMERCNARTMEMYRRIGLADEIRGAGLTADVPMD